MNSPARIRNENKHLLSLWHKAKAGDKAAFCQLADVQYRPLFAYATNFTDDREFIKDAIQDVFVRIWEKRASLTIEFVSIYLFKSLRNELLQSFRQTKQPLASLHSLQNQEVSQLSDWQTVETEIEQNETDLESNNRVRRAIDGLPKRQQEVVFLKFYEGMENDQIAELMDINRQSVANLLCRALGALKNQMAIFRYWLVALILLA